MAKTARDVMTQGAECIGENESVAEAAKKMSQLDVGALPICGEDNRLKGMLTDRDIVDGLYWRFIDRHREFFAGNPRLALMPRALDRLTDDRRERIFSAADHFLQKFTLA